MKVRKITTEQKDLLIGQTFDGVQYFNPTQDANGVWFISNEEYFNCTTDILFGWTLPEIDYNPIVVEFP
jgi:hypothetical protein